MKRRDFLKTALAGIGTSGIHPAWLRGAETKRRKPNILLIFVDDNVVETINRGGLCPNIKGLGKSA